MGVTASTGLSNDSEVLKKEEEKNIEGIVSNSTSLSSNPEKQRNLDDGNYAVEGDMDIAFPLGPPNPDNTRCWMKVSAGGENLGKVTVEVKDDVTCFALSQLLQKLSVFFILILEMSTQAWAFQI